MAAPARKNSFPEENQNKGLQKASSPLSRVPKPAEALAKPVMLDAADAAMVDAQQKLKLVDAPERTRRNSAVVTGLRDLQQLQKQTIAVLDAVKGNLEDIRQVLRSPEATRGMEKQQNAAALLAKGFAAEAAAQARGAVELLPANPEAHLLLSLSLAANQEFDEALAAARKGLALFDRRQHPLAIEAGLLHAIGALGHGAEAAQRWAEIIDALPLAVFLDHIGRIVVCYPSTAQEGQLDRALTRRLTRDAQTPASEVPSACLFAGLDACRDHRLRQAHRAIMLRITGATRKLREPAEVLRFIGDYVVPLSERGLTRTTDALANRCLKRLMMAHADAPTLYRALLKMELAGVGKPAEYLARLLAHWRAVGARTRRQRILLGVSVLVFAAGAAVFGHAAAGLAVLPAGPWGYIQGHAIEPLHVGIGVMGIGGILALGSLLRRTLRVELPFDRGSLRADEVRFVGTREVKDTFKRVLRRG